MTAPIEWLILRRELRGTLARLWLAVAVALWIGAGIFITYAGWPAETRQPFISNPQYVAQESRELLVVQFLAMLLALLLTIPALAAMSFASERATDTLDQLRLAPILGERIIMGKLIAILFVTALYLCAVVPVFAIAQFLLGLDNQQIVSVIIYLVAVTLMIASLGIACAASFRNPTNAALTAYALSVAILFGPAAIVWAVVVGGELYETGTFYETGQMMVMTMPDGLFTTPSATFGVIGNAMLLINWLAMVVGPGQVTMSLIDGPFEAIEVAIDIVVPLIVAALSLLVAARRLRHDAARKRVRGQKLIDDHAQLETRRKQFPYYLIDPLRQNPSIGDKQNPIFVREFRYGLFQRTTTMVRAAIGTFALLAILFAFAALAGRPDYIFTLIMLEIFVLVPFVPALIANSLATERDPGNLDLLRMSLIPPHTVVLGKIGGECAALAPLFVAGGLALLSPLTTRTECYFPILAGLVTLLNCAFIGAAIGITAAVVHRRPQIATITAMSATFIALIGPLALLFVGSFAEPGIWDMVAKRELTESGIFPVISPVWSYRHFVSHPGVILLELNDYGVPRDAHWWLLSQATFAAIAVALLVFATWFFRRYRMQDA